MYNFNLKNIYCVIPLSASSEEIEYTKNSVKQ